MIKLNINDKDPSEYALSTDEPVRVTPFGQGGLAVYRGIEVNEDQEPALTYEPDHYQGEEEIFAPEPVKA